MVRNTPQNLWDCLLGFVPHPSLRVVDLLLFREIFQELVNIPFATTAARERTSPSGDGIHIHTLFEQVLNVAALGATAMADYFIGRRDILCVHGCCRSQDD